MKHRHDKMCERVLASEDARFEDTGRLSRSPNVIRMGPIGRMVIVAVLTACRPLLELRLLDCPHFYRIPASEKPCPRFQIRSVAIYRP